MTTLKENKALRPAVLAISAVVVVVIAALGVASLVVPPSGDDVASSESDSFVPFPVNRFPGSLVDLTLGPDGEGKVGRPATSRLFSRGELTGIVIDVQPDAIVIAVPDLNEEYGTTPYFEFKVREGTLLGASVPDPEMAAADESDAESGPSEVVENPYVFIERRLEDFLREDVVDVKFRVDAEAQEVVATSVTFIFSVAEGSGYELVDDPSAIPSAGR